MSSQNVYISILSSPKTVFTLQSLMMLTGNYDKHSLTNSLFYYKKKGLISTPRAGIYAKQDYNPEELACAIFSFSYISLQYVLSRAGVVFQYSEAVTCISTVCRTLFIDGREYQYKRIEPEVWIDLKGIEKRNGYLIATPERALLDSLYLFPGICYFDHIDKLDKNKVFEYAQCYNNDSLIKRIEKIYG